MVRTQNADKDTTVWLKGTYKSWKCSSCPNGKAFDRLKQSPVPSRATDSLEGHVAKIHSGHGGSWEDFKGEEVIKERWYNKKRRASREKKWKAKAGTSSNGTAAATAATAATVVLESEQSKNKAANEQMGDDDGTDDEDKMNEESIVNRTERDEIDPALIDPALEMPMSERERSEIETLLYPVLLWVEADS